MLINEAVNGDEAAVIALSSVDEAAIKIE